ncbi:MAG TPA: methylated-DNA--[protein]-cysteine S-methyltransferase [Thermodesulfovibrionales bacterium]|nr:methylated-DNA--[protein]-cysteine S-methyltransferase [Thermodesulfovibrionales bacterium]
MKQETSHKEVRFVDLHHSPIGELYLTFSATRLTAIDFEKPANALPFRATRQSTLFRKELAAYFDGRLKEFGQETEFLSGTAFERAVWLCLKGIPYGETRTYRWVAEKVGRPKAMRAVGQALAKNPLPIILPCHRVVESDGSLGGYSGGVEKKRRLLALEYYSNRR